MLVILKKNSIFYLFPHYLARKIFKIKNPEKLKWNKLDRNQNRIWIRIGFVLCVTTFCVCISCVYLLQFFNNFQLNDYEIRKGKKIGVTISFNNHRLFVGNIPKNRDHDELIEEFSKHARKWWFLTTSKKNKTKLKKP